MEYIFIGGQRKSGTSLLTALLDNHPDIFAYPYNFPFYLFYPARGSQAFILERTLDHLTYHLKEMGNYKEKEIIEIRTQILEKLKSKKVQPNFINAYLESVKEVLDKKNKKYYVVKCAYLEMYSETLLEMYPNSKFISIVRNPKDVYTSILGGWDAHYKTQYDSKMDLLRDFMERGLTSYYTSIRNSNEALYYYLITYENLINNQENSMRRLANFIQIEYDDCLLQPTFLGVPWKSNSFTTDKSTKIRTNRMEIWKNIDSFYIDVIDFFFNNINVHFNYETTNSITKGKSVETYYSWLNSKSQHYEKAFRVY